MIPAEPVKTTRDSAIMALQKWYPGGGTIYVVSRKTTRRGQRIVDCKRIAASGTPLNIGFTVAEALGRKYEHLAQGFSVGERELPGLFTEKLSVLVHGCSNAFRVEML